MLNLVKMIGSANEIDDMLFLKDEGFSSNSSYNKTIKKC